RLFCEVTNELGLGHARCHESSPFEMRFLRIRCYLNPCACGKTAKLPDFMRVCECWNQEKPQKSRLKRIGRENPRQIPGTGIVAGVGMAVAHFGMSGKAQPSQTACDVRPATLTNRVP